MAWDLATYRTEIRHVADAESDARWPNDRVDSTLDIVFRREWSNILNANPYYRWALRTVTPDANGRVALSALSSGSGDTEQKFYRIMAVARGDTIYSELNFRDAPLVSNGVGEAWSYSGWYRIGNDIQAVPVDTSDLSIWVNYFPPSPGDLSATSVDVDFPEGYEMVLVYEAAALLLAKGGSEVDATGYLKALAREMREDMIGDLARTSTSPMRMGYSDGRADWAG